MSAVPTLLWWVREEDTDVALDCIASAGLALSAILVITGAGNLVIFTILWALYHSVVNIGQRWYATACIFNIHVYSACICVLSIICDPLFFFQ